MEKIRRGCACPNSDRKRLRVAQSLTALALPLLLATTLYATGGLAQAAEPTAPTPAPIGRSSLSAAGAPGNNHSLHAANSADGRYTAFASDADNLVSGDTNSQRDVFVKDNQSGGIILVSTSSRGEPSNGPSDHPAISDDGRYVAYQSTASNLIASSFLTGDNNNKSDIFIKDTQTGETKRLSTSANGGQANGDSFSPAISADGSRVAFESDANNLLPPLLLLPADSNGKRDIYVKELSSGQISRASTSAAGKQSNGHSYAPSLSDDGRLVAFESDASNLAAGDGNGQRDVLVKDLANKTVTLASQGANGASGSAALAGNGSLVAFESTAGNLVNGDSNNKKDIFIKPLPAGEVKRISVDSHGGQANGDSQFPSVSHDGHLIAFESPAANLAVGDNNNAGDVLVHNSSSGATFLLSLSAAGAPGQGHSSGAALSGDGSRVAFASEAANLVTGDNNGKSDIFNAPVIQSGIGPGPGPDPNPDPTPGQQSYYFTWYDNNSLWGMNGDSILISNLGAGAATVKIYIGNAEMAVFDQAHGNAIPQGDRVTWQAPLIVTGGPVKVVSVSGQPLGVSQRVIFNDSFNEIWAVPEAGLASDYYFTWYDNNPAWGMQGNWICIANLGSQSAAVDIYIGEGSQPVKRYQGAESLAPGAIVEWVSPTVRTDGPVQVKSSNGQKLLVSQRVVYQGSFNEVNGVSAANLGSEAVFTWYDAKPENGMKGDWILVGNIDDNTSDAARVRITIGGVAMRDPSHPERDYFDVPAGGRVTPQFTGLMDGPVQVSCLNCSAGQKLIVSQRVLYRNSFEEVQGARPDDLGNFALFNWYDAKLGNGMNGDWLLVGNSSDQPVTVFFNIGDGSLTNSATGTPYFTVAPYSHITPIAPGAEGGPVWVVCPDCYQKNVRLLISQRVVYKNSFNELFGLQGWSSS